MKKQFRLGFTLVELLVVISIIGMLAGLLLPAVNAAREAGRRAVCMNNQSQLALAIINYDSAKSSLPPMRGEIGRVASTTAGVDHANVTSWVGFLLPYMEYNQLYQNLSNVKVHSSASGAGVNDSLHVDKQLIRIKSLLCPSSDPPQMDIAPCHYVANGGYQNSASDDWTSGPPEKEFASGYPLEPGKISDAVFFDYQGYTAYNSGTDNTICRVKCSIDYMSSHSGTSHVILLSENERAISTGSGHQWAYWSDTTNSNSTLVHKLYSQGEDRVAFCFPYNTDANLDTAAKVAARKELRLAEYDSTNTSTKWSFRGYATAVEDPSTTTTYDIETPVWINVARGDAYSGMKDYRRARPSSNHPGIVLAAFADRSVRPLLDTMDKQTFVWLCQPNSGNVVGSID